MKRIDRETVQRILDSANIVEVVSDFVSLKRRGANYIGLCPFHNERTPSFSVSPAKGLCKCFSCGKGGSPVGFIMEHEQMTYNEALRYLARKYNIEIKEHDMTDEERRRESEREKMFALNEFALKQFEHDLFDTEDGRDIGIAYFHERGISDVAIRRFHLGYSLPKGNTLCEAAIRNGFSEDVIVSTGLGIRRDDGSVYDRFRSRVIYPVHTISGKVVAFGGRTLRNDKKTAKYVNSPESSIYSKSRELYGLYQAKKSIVEKKKCILVEGYMDVISMSQLGIENIVASSGTSLTEGQIRLIHRFTDNVTVIYDSDPAGIKASLRGIDLLLAEGLNIKVVLLPDGDDPDSFAQAHSLTEVEEYIAAHEQDFIRFKTDILLHGSENDPVKKSQVITDVVRSISVIPNEITRTIYVKECSRSLDIDEKVLLREINKLITQRAVKDSENRQRQKAIESIGNVDDTAPAEEQTVTIQSAGSGVQPQPADMSRAKSLLSQEQDLIRYIIKYGMVSLPMLNEEGETISVSVVEYISDELAYDNIRFSNTPFQRIMDECLKISRTDWKNDYESFFNKSMQIRSREWEEGESRIRSSASNLEQIKALETKLTQEIDDNHTKRLETYTDNYLIKYLASSPDDETRSIVTRLSDSPYHLSKVHSKYTRIETERDKLLDLLPRAIYVLKDAIVVCRIKELRDRLRTAPDATETLHTLSEINTLNEERRHYAKLLGERVVLPK